MPKMKTKKKKADEEDDDEEEVTTKKKKSKKTKAKAEDDEDEEEEDEEEDDEDEEDEDESNDDDDDDDEDDEESEDEEDDDEDDADDDEEGSDDDDEEDVEDEDEDEEEEDDEEEDEESDDDEEEEDEDSEDEEEDEEDDESGGSSSSWKFTGNEAEKALKSHNAATFGARRPETWLDAKNPEKTFRILNVRTAPLIFQHTFQRKTQKGIRYDKQTCSGKNCRFCAHGYDRSAMRPLIVNDFTPFTDKAGKTIKMSQRFFPTTDNRYQQLVKIDQKLVKRYKKGLHKFHTDVSRTGTGQKTTYTFMPDTKPRALSEIESKLPSLEKKIAETYKPMSLSEQKAYLNRLPKTGEMGDD